MEMATVYFFFIALFFLFFTIFLIESKLFSMGELPIIMETFFVIIQYLKLNMFKFKIIFEDNIIKFLKNFE